MHFKSHLTIIIEAKVWKEMKIHTRYGIRKAVRYAKSIYKWQNVYNKI